MSFCHPLCLLLWHKLEAPEPGLAPAAQAELMGRNQCWSFSSSMWCKGLATVSLVMMLWGTSAGGREWGCCVHPPKVVTGLAASTDGYGRCLLLLGAAGCSLRCSRRSLMSAANCAARGQPPAGPC